MNGGEIVEVDGGHIIRSRGRKDRHSKVCTAKGPRDRRVRLSAHTAIEFYDVQDRLGFDRPSKALDWLINKAKPAIDQLDQLPPWKPTLLTKQQQQQQNDDVSEKLNGNGDGNENENEFRFLQNFNSNNSGFVPFESEIGETTSSSPIQFPDLLSRTNSNDLRLSLQQNQHVQPHVLFTGNFDGMLAWNSGGGAAAIDTGGSGGGGGNNDDASGGGFVFNTPSPSPVVFPAVMYGQNQYLSQRGPLQSSYNPSVRAWIDAADYRRQVAATAALGAGFASGGFSGFRVPARIGGDDDEVHGGLSNRPSSASSDSRR
ncbi:hypothetical protein TSUD_52940 [Trifolium subterraneum]|uniref:TCP domain-containing protein n=1 Tax=Trifolium subterraneum TaxID=3900 RepID=A0A2Z6MXT7_TRISU|nr:hypothetical protein TSUD_52940 [Trifolium subterraneum]